MGFYRWRTQRLAAEGKASLRNKLNELQLILGTCCDELTCTSTLRFIDSLWFCKIQLTQSRAELIGTALPVTGPVTHVAPREDEFPTFAFHVYEASHFHSHSDGSIRAISMPAYGPWVP